MQVQPRRQRLSIGDSFAGIESANYRSSSANRQSLRSSFDGLAGNKLEQTFTFSQERGEARDINMSSASANEDFGRYMWGYSPNFNMKQQQRSRSLEGGADQFNKLTVEDENSERENRKILSEKIKALQKNNATFGPEVACELIEILLARSYLWNNIDLQASPQYQRLLEFQDRDTAAK